MQIQALIEKGEYDDAVAQSSNQHDHYLSKLIKKTRTIDLARHPTWLTLIHYKQDYFGNYLSQVDGRDFFFSKDGKDNPQAELEATLAAMLSSRELKTTKLSAQCRFIARFHWLNQQLDFDENQLATEECKDFDLFIKILAPEKITVVFPTTHPNSPSSMFGHTLLRVDKKSQTEQTKMLNYSVNYAAQVDPSINPLSYSMLGLSGGFPGKFSVVPYYTKLREYAQMENRDIWEYTLNIGQEDIRFILMHVYELAPSYFDYYFFTENCSYHLLSLLDVTFAEHRLTDHFTRWTIPVDTLRLLREKNLITDVRYNASHARKIRAQQQTMLPEDIKLSQSAFETNFESIRTQLENLNKERQIQVLDLLNDYYRYQKLKDSEHSANQLNNKERKVLLARSKIQQASFSPRIPPPSTHPDLGHRTSTLALGATRNMGNKGISLLWRPAYHDLLDPSIGFSSNSSLNFMNVDINYNIDKQKLILDEVRFLEIFSVEPRDEFFKDISWHLSTGWKKQPEPGANNLSYFEGGAGHAYSLGKKENFVFYGLVEGYLGHSWELKNNIRIAPKLRLGFISEPFQGWRLHAYATSLKELIGNKSRVDSFVIQQSLAISRNLSMRISTQRNAKDGLQWHEFGAALHYYF